MDHNNHSYRNLAIMMVGSFISMYVLMYSMVDVFGNVVNNLNQVYMAALMSAPMLVMELILMKMMYKDKRLNAILIGVGVLVGILSFAFIRQQTAIADVQFLRSMIPHHSGAILMCEQSALTDPEVIELCEQIVQAQEEEIAEMRAILDRMGK